jgi:type II secretory pathway pseudopilin PulG
MSNFLRSNQKGMSLVEVLVSIGISTVISFVMATTMVNVSRDQRALQEKYNQLELKNDLLTAFANTDICLSQLNQNSPTLNLSGVSASNPSKQSISYSELHMGNSNQSLLLAKVGSPLPGSSPNQMVVSKIELGSFLSTGSPNTFTGELKIEMDPATLTRALKPLSIKQIFNIAGPVASAKIVGCGVGSGNNFGGVAHGVGTFTGNYTAKNAKSYPIMVTANDGKTLLGPGDERSNSCNLNGLVNGNLIIHQVDNNIKYYKSCTISFWVGPGSTYTVTSAPYPMGNGQFWLLETY